MIPEFRSIALCLLVCYTTGFVYGQAENAEPFRTDYQFQVERWTRLELSTREGENPVYLAEFSREPDWDGKQLFLNLSSINVPFDLWVNKFRFGSGDGSGSPLEFNITPFVNQEINELEIRPRTDEATDISCWFARIIARESFLVRDLQISSFPGEPSGEASVGTLVRIHLWLTSYQTGNRSPKTVSVTLKDPSGDPLATLSREFTSPLSFRQETEMIFDQHIPDPETWIPSRPNLYMAEITVEQKGEPFSEAIWTRFGIPNISLQDTLIIAGTDTLDIRDHFELLPEQSCRTLNVEFLEQIKDSGNKIVKTSHPIPWGALDWFDWKGIILLREPIPGKSYPFPWEYNHPCVFWME